MSKETFKIFAVNHPELSKHVIKGDMTWQKFYEMYDIYGENNEVWNSYLTNSTRSVSEATNVDGTMKELINMVKKVDLETVKKGVTGLQKAIGLVQDLGFGNSTGVTNSYEPRPMYKYFDD